MMVSLRGAVANIVMGMMVVIVLQQIQFVRTIRDNTLSLHMYRIVIGTLCMNIMSCSYIIEKTERTSLFICRMYSPEILYM
jgi:hypothetical protein